MKKKIAAITMMTVMAGITISGCGNSSAPAASSGAAAEAAATSSAENNEKVSIAAASETETVSASSQEAVETATSGSQEADAEPEKAPIADGVYTAEFNTDSSMFHVNESKEGKGELTVQDGKMTIHISLVSKNIVNLFPGTADEAQEDGAVLLEPTTDTVTYSDGYTEEVYGFDVPVPYLDEEFDLALIGTKGTWYDHKVSVSNPVSVE